MAPWVYDPHSGGVKIPLTLQTQLLKAAKRFSLGKPWYPSQELVLRFHSQFCYVDTIEVGDKRQFPLCRLRHFTQESFSLSLFTYSQEKYETCYFPNGSPTGTLIDALKACELFII